jgi:two-component system, LytTR family, response regulator
MSAERVASRAWRALIADDEPLARARLRGLLERHPAFTVVGECSNGDAVLAALDENPVDVLFLDIRMPHLDGVGVAEALLHDRGVGRGYRPAVIFVSAYDDHAVQAFDLDAIDYLVKPVDIDRFARAIERVSSYLERSVAEPGSEDEGSAAALRAALASITSSRSAYPARFAVRDARGVYFVPIDDVERIEADGNYVALHASGRRHLMRETMRGIETRLDPSVFVRVHRSAIVRIDSIRLLEPCGHGEYVITMRSGARLTSSRSCGEGVRRLIR